MVPEYFQVLSCAVSVSWEKYAISPHSFAIYPILHKFVKFCHQGQNLLLNFPDESPGVSLVRSPTSKLPTYFVEISGVMHLIF
jgi:hypothetical protein